MATSTVRTVTHDLLRKLGLTTFFGNPGSTEETFLKDFPADFTYHLALQEASAIAIADGYAQATGKPALVNVHTAAGLGNAMGNLITASLNKTPLIITAGQQTREMLLMEPWLTNVDSTQLPRPWVKWAYEPTRPEDVPAAFMRAYATAVQAPAGPVFLSLPLDDWDKPLAGPAVLRSVSRRIAPDMDRLRAFADLLSKAKSPALIFGAAIDRGQGWPAAVALAEKLGATVFAAPASERCPFPETHPLYAGGLPFAIGPLCERLKGHDLAIVIGAPVFRYYPYVAGDYLPQGTRLLHISDDPAETARAPVGDSLVADAVLATHALIDLVKAPESPATASRVAPAPPSHGAPSRAPPGPAPGRGERRAHGRRRVRRPGPGAAGPLRAGGGIALQPRRSAPPLAHHRAGDLLHLRLGWAGLEPAGLRGHRFGRAVHRAAAAGDGGHRRRVFSVFSTVLVDRRAA